MIRNFFKIAWRNLVKDRQFSFLNLVGLSIGLASALLICLWVHDELSVDKFNEKDNQLYSVLKTAPGGDGTIGMYGTTQGLLAKSMAAELPEVEYAVAVRSQDPGVISTTDKHIKAKTQLVDKDFFNIFSYPIIEGNKSNPFADKYGVLLSHKLALKLFNTTKNIIGKTIDWNGGDKFDGQYTVAGVFEAPPSNATAQFDFLFSYELYLTKDAEDVAFWGSNGVVTYVMLKKGTNATEFNKKIKDFTKEKIKTLYKDDNLLQWEGDLFVQRYSDGYLYNRYENGVQSGGRIEYVRLFSIIAIFLVVIACINFMNLSTAKASKRIKEVGIKKVVGASRGSLILQYMGESMMMAFLSLLIAIVLVALFLPAFKEITGKNILLQFSPNLIFSASVITFITGLIAGSYPAFYLSGFRPVSVLKGKVNTSAGESWLRKGLVVFQFAVSVVLIVSVLVVYKQMNLIQTVNLGYNKDNVIRFSNEGKLEKGLQTFLSKLKNIPGVVNASSMDGNMTGNYSQGGSMIDWEGKQPDETINFMGIDMNYGMMEILDMQMKEGRMFSGKFGSDSSSVIFNEAAVAAMGLKDPVGKIVTVWREKKRIVGVVKDFHFESFYKKVAPFFLRCSQNNSNVFVKIKAGTERQTISRVENLYKEFNDGLPLDYKFLDDDFQALYSSEQRVAVLSRYFAGIAILISCLGLFGLAAFTAQKRQKEIGIRKVVGASVSNIAVMLSADFLKLVLVALLIAIPLSWWATHQWLQAFAYRININAAIFLITGASVVLITLVTVSFQAIKAALANPVKSLRTE